MKRVYPIVFLLSICFPAKAQSDSAAIRRNWEASIDAILQKQNNTANKTTQIKQRLVGIIDSVMAYNNSPAYIQDSSVFKYSGSKGSSFYFSDMTYSSDYISSTYYGYYGPGTVNSDTSIVFQYQVFNRYINHYTASGKKDSVTLQTHDTLHTTFIPKTRYSAQFNAAGNVNVSYNDTWDTTLHSWKPYTKTAMIYDSNNRLSSDTIYNVTTGTPVGTQWVYNHHNVAGNVDTTIVAYANAGVWQQYALYTYSYYVNNFLKESTYKINGTFTNRDSFGYQVNVDFQTYEMYYAWNATTNSWVFNHSNIKYLNTSGLPDSMIYNHSGGYIVKYTYSYNSYQNPVSALMYNTYANNGLTPVLHYLYYYETYDDLAVIDVSHPSNLLLYPNPTTATLNIQRSNISSGDFVTIYNALGQKVALQQLDNNLAYPIPVADFTPGIYWLVLHGKDGSITARQSFIKQ